MRARHSTSPWSFPSFGALGTALNPSISREYEGNCLIDIRIWRTAANGIDYPSTKGLALSVGKLKELVRALVKAEAAARELGLLPPDDGGGS